MNKNRFLIHLYQSRKPFTQNLKTTNNTLKGPFLQGLFVHLSVICINRE